MIDRRQPGFFISEFLLYLALSGCVAVFVMQYVYGTSIRLRQTTLTTDRIASLYMALDAICNDIEKAPCLCSDWRTLTHDELAWQQGDTRIGWKIDDGSLKRSVQNYQNREEKWKRSVTHIALEDVVKLCCMPHYENKELHNITIELQARVAVDKVYTVQRAVAVQQSVRV